MLTQYEEKMTKTVENLEAANMLRSVQDVPTLTF